MHMVSARALEQGNTLTDEQVVANVLAGQTALFEVLMRRYNERVYRVVRGILRSDEAAEEVMQQAYVNAYSHLRQFGGYARFSTWLTRIAINEALARVRANRRYTPFDEDSSNVEPFMTPVMPRDPERQAFTGELRALLEEAIDSLPDGAREVFVMRDVEEMSTADVASSLGVSEDVVKTRLSRARRTLRQTLLQRTGASAPDTFHFYRPRCDRVVAAVMARITAPRA